MSSRSEDEREYEDARGDDELLWLWKGAIPSATGRARLLADIQAARDHMDALLCTMSACRVAKSLNPALSIVTQRMGTLEPIMDRVKSETVVSSADALRHALMHELFASAGARDAATPQAAGNVASLTALLVPNSKSASASLPGRRDLRRAAACIYDSKESDSEDSDAEESEPRLHFHVRGLANKAYGDPGEGADHWATAALRKASPSAAALSLLRTICAAVRGADAALPATAAADIALSAFAAAIALARAAAAEAAVAVHRAVHHGVAGPHEHVVVTPGRKPRRQMVELMICVGEWQKAYYGLGLAVVMQRKFRVGWGSAAAGGEVPAGGAAAAAGQVEWVGQIVCDSCRSFALPKAGSPQPSAALALSDESNEFRDAQSVEEGCAMTAMALRFWPMGRDMPPQLVQGATEWHHANLTHTSPSDAAKARAGAKDAGAVDASLAAASCQLEVCAWGATSEAGLDSSGSGPERGKRPPFRRPEALALRFLSPTERVASIACSSRHTLIVTSRGNLFAAGDGRDGALGTGDLEPSVSRDFRLVSWFREQADQPKIVQAAAGSDILGCHSACIDEDGRLYTWGAGAAVGQGTTKPVPLPSLVNIMAPPASAAAQAAAGVGGTEPLQVRSVSCGGGFTLVLTKCGAVYSFGSWARGRLGLGRPPELTADGKKRVLRFQLRPARIEAFGPMKMAAIACGKWHALAATDYGAVFSWGHNASGQLGRPGGPQNLMDKFNLQDSWLPAPVVQFAKCSSIVSAVNVACGSNHSVVLDTSGAVWAWGAQGGACLGLGLSSTLPDRRKSASSAAPQQQQFVPLSRALPPDEELEALAMAQGWAWPQRVAALEGIVVEKVTAGARHTAFVTSAGALLLCGDGAALAAAANLSAAPPSEPEDQASPSAARRSKVAQPPPSSVAAVPRQACWSFLAELAGRQVCAAASGGQHLVAVLGAEDAAVSLGGELFRHARAATEDASAIKYSRNGAVQPDCALVVAGSSLFAHRIVLSSRCPALRNAVVKEQTSSAAGGGGGALEVLLPDLRADVAEALLEYLYTDAVTAPLEAASPLATDLATAAEAYGLPRLAAICRRAVATTYPPRASDAPAAPASAAQLPSFEATLAIPESTFAVNFGTALGDPLHADVRFIAEGRPIYAHKAILAARSEYFAAMFRSGMREGSASGDGSGVVEVEVPDSHAATLRLLLFLYSGHLAPAPSCAEALSDLLAADRYDIPGLRQLCESAVELDDAGCTAALAVSEAVTAPLLRQAALSYVQTRMGDVLAPRPEFLRLLRDSPALADELLERLRAAAAPAALVAARPPAGEQRQSRKEKDLLEVVASQPFPWAAAVVALVLALLYARVAGTLVLGPLVPMLNTALILGLATFAYFRLGGQPPGKKRRSRKSKALEGGSAATFAGGIARLLRLGN